MIGRRQLPVHSPIRVGTLARAAIASRRSAERERRAAATALAGRFAASRVVLTDCGTSALALALAATAGCGGTVAFPAYACINLAAAAILAGVRVRLYDVDPATLSPDLDSVRRTLDRGVDTVVVAHLHGYPADVPGVAALAAARGIPVIEDAAQGAGGSLYGTRLGGFGALTVLSFGRGKGMTAGNGGALLAVDQDWAAKVAAAGAASGTAARGWRDLAAATAQWALGRPGLYAVPAAIPALRLGEMVYHPAQEPRPMSDAAAVLLRQALRDDPPEVARRYRTATALLEAIRPARDLAPARPIAGGECGYLRLAVADRDGRLRAQAQLGIAPGYPRTLVEQHELRPLLLPDETEHPGAAELRRTLITLPTHRFVTPGDVRRIGERACASGAPAAVPIVRQEGAHA